MLGEFHAFVEGVDLFLVFFEAVQALMHVAVYCASDDFVVGDGLGWLVFDEVVIFHAAH